MAGKYCASPRMKKLLDGGMAEAGGVGNLSTNPKGKQEQGLDGLSPAVDLFGNVIENISASNKHDFELQPGQTSVRNGQSSAGIIAGGAGKGAVAGAKIGGPLGAAVGGAIGIIGGIFGASAERKRENAEQRKLESMTKNKYNKLNLSANLDPYGSETVFYAEDGGMVGPGKRRRNRQMDNQIVTSQYGTSGIIGEHGNTNRPTLRQSYKNVIDYLNNNWSEQSDTPSNIYRPEFHHKAVNSKSLLPVPIAEDGYTPVEDMGVQEQQPEVVDIELGEILIDSTTLDVVREYSNKNRYKPHAKNPQFESVGNFTLIKPGQVVISKKYAERFKNGDSLTKKSIVMEILKNQRNEGTPTVAAPVGMAPQAVDGYGSGPGPGIKGMKGLAKLMNDLDGIKDPRLGNTGNYSNYSTAPEPSVRNTVSADRNIPGIEDWDFSNTANTDNSTEQNSGGNSGNNFGKKLGKVFTPTNIARGLNFLPTVYGMVSAGRDEKTAYDENNQFETAKSYVAGMETNPTIEASRRAIGNTTAAANKMLNNINSPSVRSELASRHADLLEAEGNLIQNATNFAIDARNKKRTTLADLEVNQGNMRLNSRNLLRDTIAQNAAAKTRMLQSGLSEGVRNFGIQVMDDNKLRALNSMMDYYKIGNDGGLQDTKKFTEDVMALVNSGVPMDKALSLKWKEEAERKNQAGIKTGTTTRTRYQPPAKTKI